MVQVIPKTEISQEPVTKKILPWLSFLLIIIVFFLYFIFSHQIVKTKVSLEQTKEELNKAQTVQQKETERRIETLKVKIDDVIKLLQERKKASKFFGFLEALVHPNVYFTSLSLSLDKGSAKAEGVSSDFTSLGQQILVFEKDPFIKKVNLSNIGLSKEGLVKFSIDIVLASEKTDKNSSK